MTRWTGLYSQVINLLENFKKIPNLMKTIGPTNNKKEPEEIHLDKDFLISLRDFLYPFTLFHLKLQSKNKITMHLIIPIINSTINHIENDLVNQHFYINIIKQRFKYSFRKKSMQYVKDIHFTATFLSMFHLKKIYKYYKQISM